MKPSFSTALVVAASLIAGLPVLADPDVVRVHSVAGEKLDSGLGELPAYAQWTDPTGRQPVSQRVPGEKQDSGLGELPHYSKWKDPTGKNPMMGAAHATINLALR
jgi:hypothetical protein